MSADRPFANVSESGDARSSAVAPRLLIVEEDNTLRESCRNLLAGEGYEVRCCARGDEARELLRRQSAEVALVGLAGSQEAALEVLKICREANPEMRVIATSGSPSVDASLAALEAGAWHYLPKPFTASHLQVLIARAIHELSSLEPRDKKASGGKGAADDPGVVLLGRSPAFQRVLKLATQVASTDASVLLTGESGAGKEVIAQFIHQQSRRRRLAMVALNCAALPESLLESEMFGHVKGAFTGAIRDKPGLLEAADHGTLFLDELTEMTPSIQAKLLRVLQDGVVRRVGSEAVDASVDVRFIAATNRDPLTAVRQGVLRKDLYYRLSVVPIRVPSLRERLEDIPLLAEHFLQRYWEKHREADAPLPTFSPEAFRLLQSRRWSGNVRELQNLIEHTVVLLQPGSAIRPDDLPFRDGGESVPDDAFGDVSMDELLGMDYHDARERLLGEFERRYVREVVQRSGGNMFRAAKVAGLDRTTLYRIMDRHHLQKVAVISEA